MSAANLRHVPSVEKLAQAVAGAGGLPRRVIAEAARGEAERVRASLLAGAEPEAFDQIAARLQSELAAVGRSALRPVINGTGVVLHTNLGRAPWGGAVAGRVAAVASGYSNLELDLETGERGRRAPLVDRLLAILTGAEAVCVVNNCAAAVVLVLRHVCAGERKEVVVSRGELVEIGGGFRVPEIMETSGARLREVGTTNRTTAADYERAIGPTTAAILRVHRSNFYLEGFTESPPLGELAALAQRAGIPLIEDLGSGAMVDTASLATLEHEPTVAESLRSGADLVCVSGDKLLGGPQAGIIAGSARWVGQVRKDPFFRVLRCDKFLLAALQETALAYLAACGDTTPAVPVLLALGTKESALHERAVTLAAALGPRVTVGQGTARCGGGTMPRSAVGSVTLDLAPDVAHADEMARRLRLGEPPVIGYLADGMLKIDLRTVFPEQDEALAAAIKAAIG